MREYGFIQKDGQAVEPDIIRQRFFESAARSRVNPDRASAVWQAAVRGDPRALDIIARRMRHRNCR